MKLASISLIAILAYLMPTIAADSGSLADLAKKEQERRAKITSETKVITNDDSDKYRAGAVTTGTPYVEPPAEKARAEKDGSEAASAKGVEASPDEPVDLQGRPESFWRQTMSDARKQVKDLENQGDVLVLKLNSLQTKFYSEDNGFKQQEIQTEINKTFYEQDLIKENLKKAKDQLDDLEKEARKSGALPGWINP